MRPSRTLQGTTDEGPTSLVSRTRLSQLGFALAISWLLWPVVIHAAEVWLTVEEFSFGVLIPPLVVLLVWGRRALLRQAVRRGSPAGLAVVVGALALYLVAQHVAIHAFAGLAVGPLLGGWRSISGAGL